MTIPSLKPFLKRVRGVAEMQRRRGNSERGKVSQIADESLLEIIFAVGIDANLGLTVAIYETICAVMSTPDINV
jgi:hypothetical protein